MGKLNGQLGKAIGRASGQGGATVRVKGDGGLQIVTDEFRPAILSTGILPFMVVSVRKWERVDAEPKTPFTLVAPEDTTATIEKDDQGRLLSAFRPTWDYTRAY